MTGSGQTVSIDAIRDLVELMSKLRDRRHGCRWDLKQNMRTLVPHTLEEVYEVVDAVEQGEPEKICDELGDLLFQVVFYAQIAAEENLFDLDDVARNVFDKLLSRHPHVFPDGTLDSFASANAEGIDPRQVEVNWESIKNAERAARGADANAAAVSVLDDVPRALPAVHRARKLQKRAASKGFDWPDRPAVLAKLQEEIAELQEAIEGEEEADIEAEFGDVLFTCINLSRHLRLDPEQALRGSNARFEQRFRRLESNVHGAGKRMDEESIEQLESWWQAAKRQE